MIELMLSSKDCAELILRFFKPEEVVNLLLIDKRSNSYFKGLNYWEEAFKLYFPYDYRISKFSKLKVAWADRFNQTFREHYQETSAETRRLFCAVSVHDMSVIQSLRLIDLSEVNDLDDSLIEFIAMCAHQPTMDYVFKEIILPEYCNDSGIETNVILELEKNDSMRFCVEGLTVLQFAARLNQAKFIEEALSDLDMNDYDEDAAYREARLEYDSLLCDSRPISIAAKYGHFDTIKTLIKLGAKLDFPCYFSEHLPLEQATRRGNIEEVKFLLSCGAQIKKAVCVAAERGRWEIFQFLVSQEKTFDVSQTNDDGMRVFYLINYAIRGGNIDIFEAVIRMNLTPMDIRDWRGNTPLQWAAQYGRLAMFDRLLSLGADPDPDNTNGKRLFHCALRGANTTLIGRANQFRINSALTLDQQLKRCLHYPYSTPLHECVMFRSVYSADETKTLNTIQALLSRQVDVNAQNILGETPLFIAMVCRQSITVIKLLLDVGANPTIANLLGETPLHKVAVSSGSNNSLALSQLIQLLIDRGADVNAVNAQHKTPLDCNIAKLLEKSHDINSVHRYNVCIFALLKNGANFSALMRAYNETKNNKLGYLIAQLLEVGNGVPQDLAAASSLYADLGLKKAVKRVRLKLEELGKMPYFLPLSLFEPPRDQKRFVDEASLSSPKKQKIRE